MIKFDIFDILLSPGSGILTMSQGEYNICITLGTNGSNLRGFGPLITNTEGSINPTIASDGTEIYSFYWDISTGKFIMQFGTSGDTQLDNNSMIIDDSGLGLSLMWDDLEKYYTDTDKDASDTISSTIGEKECFLLIAIPRLLIHYDFSEIVDENIGNI